MLSKTSKSVLCHLTDVVEKLMQILADCNEQKKPIPDLVNMSLQVFDQTQLLCQVAHKIIQEPNSDKVLQQEMQSSSQAGKAFYSFICL
jgi:hypothetical protein